jgi:uracil-DNA glycosylase family 4
MPVTGEGRLGVLVIAEAPGAKEDERNEQLIGKAGQRLRSTLEPLGVDLDEDCWKTNAIICFISPKVTIYTSKGYKQISRIQVGDLVLTDKGRFKRVISRSVDLPLHQRQNKRKLVDIRFANHKLTVTADHLFYTRDGWKRADQLLTGEEVRALGEKCIVCGVVYFKQPGRFDTAESTCSPCCHNIMVSRKNGPAISKSLRQQYETGQRDPILITNKAHLAVKKLMLDGKWADMTARTDEGKKRAYRTNAQLRQGHNNLKPGQWIGDWEQTIANYLKSENIEYFSQYAIGSRNVDFYLPDHKLMIEVENNNRPESYFSRRIKLAESMGCKLVFLQSTNPLRELQRLLKNDTHNYYFTWMPLKSVTIRLPARQEYLYCIEVEEDASYVAKGLVSHNCRPPNNRTPTEEELDCCRPNLVKTIEELQPHTIIVLGEVALRQLINPWWHRDIGGIGRWAGFRIPLQSLNAWVCPTWHPSYLEREGAKDGNVLQLWFSKHLESAFEKKERPWSIVPNYQAIVEQALDPSSIMEEMKDYSGMASFDYETNMLKPDNNKAACVSCSIAWGKGRVSRCIAYVMTAENKRLTRSFLRSPIPKIGASIKFEERWSLRHFGTRVRNWFWDTMLCAHVLDNRPGITSLDFQAFVRLGLPTYSAHISPLLKTKDGTTVNQILTEISTSELLKYNGLDAISEFEVAVSQMKELGQRPPWIS